MNTRASMARRDLATACAIMLAVAALLFAWSPSLRPGVSPARLTPPTIRYNDESPDTYARCDRDPALIALSAAMILSPANRSQTDTLKPPLDAASHSLRFPDAPAIERNEQNPLLTPPRPMTLLAPQRFALPASMTAGGRIGTLHPAPSPYRVDLTGHWQGRSVDLAPMSGITEPPGPWSFTAVLRYDETGRIQHALLESAAVDLPLRNEIARRLYQCRVIPSGVAGEGRLTVSGPGRP